MKISNPNGSAIPPPIQEVAPPAGETGSANGASRVAPLTGADQYQLSSLSAFLSGSQSHIAKLSELISAVSSGKYQVNARAVSAGIIRESLRGSLRESPGGRVAG